MLKKLLCLTLTVWYISAAQAPAAKPNMLELVSQIKPIQKIISDYCGLQYQLSDSKWKDVIACAFSPDGKYFAIALVNMNFVYILDARTFVPVYKLAHTTAKSIVAVAYAIDGKTLACCDKTGKLFLWDATNFNVKKRTKLFVGPKVITKIEFMGDTKLITIDPERKSELYLFDIETETGGYISGSESDITACALESGKYIQTKQLDANSGSVKHIACASKSALGIYTLGGKFGNKIVRPEVLPQDTAIKTMCYSPCGRYIATTGEDEELTIQDLANNCVAEKIDANYDGEIKALAYSHDGSLVAADPAGLRLYVPMMLAQEDLTNFIVKENKEPIQKTDTAITLTPAKRSATAVSDDEATLRLVRKLEEEASLQLARKLEAQNASRYTATETSTSESQLSLGAIMRCASQSRYSAAQTPKYIAPPITITMPSDSDTDPVTAHEKKIHAEMVQQAFSGRAQYWIKKGTLVIQDRFDNTQIISVPTRLADTTEVKIVDALILEIAFPYSTTYYKIEDEFLKICDGATNKVLGKPKFFQKK